MLQKVRRDFIPGIEKCVFEYLKNAPMRSIASLEFEMMEQAYHYGETAAHCMQSAFDALAYDSPVLTWQEQQEFGKQILLFLKMTTEPHWSTDYKA